MQIQISPRAQKLPIAQNIARLAERAIRDRCGERATSTRSLRFDIDAKIGRESFRIADDGAGILVTGGDARGLLYGAGKMLRDGRFGADAFTPGAWRGHSAPQKPLRGIYLATHFHNFYHDAPLSEVERYIEELGLWGFNTVCVWFDMHEYRGLQDPEAQAMLQRLRKILTAAKRIGLDTALTVIANEAYADSPRELRAQWLPQNGYHAELQGHYHVEICPNQPGATELILRQREAVLAQFKTAGLDYLVIWPYDQGGCTGKECAPWGGNGFLKLAPKIAALFRREFPKGKVVLSTWYFDHFTSGEWEMLAQHFETKADWVNYILADDAPAFPRFPLERGVPGKLPMIGFPEISMRGAGGWGPWGGFGANPFPQHLQARHNQAGAKLAGGFPYSEGLFEDINKIVCAGFDWENRAADATLREYIAYEFSPDVVDEVMRAIPILEANLTRATSGEGASTRFVMPSVAGAREADALLEKAQGKLSPRAKTAWRWRVLRLRAALDVELSQNEFALTSRTEEMLRELTQIYHAQNAAAPVAPPTQDALRANRPV